MAAIRTYVSTRTYPDGLCPHCHNPALKLYDLVRINWDGLTVVGHRTACVDCKVWTTKLEPVAPEEAQQ